MEKIKIFTRFLERWWFFIVCFTLVLLAIPSAISPAARLIFLLYAFFIFWIMDSIFEARKESPLPDAGDSKEYHTFFSFLLIFSFLFLILTRLLPFLRFGEAPLGYDTGFYLQAVKTGVDSALPATRGFYLILLPLQLLGMSPLVTLYFIYILAQFLIAGGLYLLLRSLKSPSSFQLASVVVFLFSVSIIQFLGYWSAFGQQMLATGFLLLTIALFLRQSPLVILAAAMTFFTHTPTFAILGLIFLFFILIYIGQIIFRKRHFNPKTFLIFCLGLLILALAFSSKQDQLLGEINYVLKHKILLKNYPSWALFEARGGFIELISFRFFILLFLPLSLLGALCPWVWRIGRPTSKFFLDSLLIFYLALIVLSILTFAPVLYQSRFSIIFDIFLIIFAGPPLLLIMNYFLPDKMGKVFLSFLIIVFFTRTGLTVWAQEPLISRQEIQEIEKIPQSVEPKGIIMATDSSYGPWLQGFSDREVISPGHLYDTWSLSDWLEFWQGQDNEEKFRLLEKRQRPLYIHLGQRQPQGLPYQDLIRNDPHFSQISPHLWRFKPNL